MEAEPSPSSSLSSSQQQQQQQQPVAGPSKTRTSRAPSRASRASVSASAASAEASTSSHAHNNSEGGSVGEHCSFVLLAEFDIDRGSTLAHVYPSPALVEGHDDHALAELMLPDGAHARSEDWTTFFLTDKGKGAAKTATDQGDRNHPPLTYVLNLVRTKHDASVRRGALVKAIAIGSRHPCLRVFKPILLLALDEYFNSPGPATLTKLYEAINSLDLSSAPTFSRSQKLILRCSDRKDLFADRFPLPSASIASDGSRPAMGRKASVVSVRSHAAQQGRASPFSWRDGGGGTKDTHLWETSIPYGKIDIPIRWPLDEWEDEIGEYSLSLLFQTFSSHPPAGPLHAHLHSNGSQTHPLTLLFNALQTYKRVIFLGHNLPAATVASHVLAASALGSGCGGVIPGFKERVHPYANLISLDTLEETEGFVAGVTNPRFEELRCWDVLCNIETGKITVSKHIEPAPLPAFNSQGAGSSSIGATTGGGIGSVNGSMGLSNDASTHGHHSSFSIDSSIDPGLFTAGGGGISSDGPSSSSIGGVSLRKGSLAGGNSLRTYRSGGTGSISGGISEFGAFASSSSGATTPGGIPDGRNDSPDNLFMEDLTAAVNARYSEQYVRARVMEYALHFTRLVTRHEEQFYPPAAMSGSVEGGAGGTALMASMLERFPHQPYLNGQLGSGIAFGDREGEARELACNAGRVEGFRSSPGYATWLAFDAKIARGETNITEVDVWHQIARLKGRGRPMHSSEAGLIFATLSKNVRSEGQVLEILSYLPSYSGGLTPLALGLYHSSSSVRNAACDLLSRLTAHTSVGLKMVQALPLYHRLAFARLRQERAEQLEQAAAARAGVQHQAVMTGATPAAAAPAGSAGSMQHLARSTPPPWSANSVSSAMMGRSPSRDREGAISPSVAMNAGRAEGKNGTGAAAVNSGLSAAYREMGLAQQQT